MHAVTAPDELRWAEALHQERLAKAELNQLMNERSSGRTKSIRPESASYVLRAAGVLSLLVVFLAIVLV